MFTNRFFLLVIVALAAIAALTFREAVATAAVTFNSQEMQSMKQSRAADAARWAAMGEYYEKLGSPVESLSRARAADASRWKAMSEYYQKLTEAESQNLQRGRTADAARWTAMAEYYAQIVGATR